MKYGGFIFGADEEHQKKQRKGIRALAKANSAEVKWFVEDEGRQRRDAEDREELQACARYCRTNNATFALSSLKGFAKRKWQGMTWLKHQVEMYDMKIAVADDPRVSKGSLHVLSAAADFQRQRIAETSRAALADIKRRLDAGEEVIAKRSGQKVEKLGTHQNIKKAAKLLIRQLASFSQRLPLLERTPRRLSCRPQQFQGPAVHQSEPMHRALNAKCR